MNHTPQPEPEPARVPAGAQRNEAARARRGAVVVPLPVGTRPRRAPSDGEARGEILLFLGVRYERLAS